MVQYLSIEEGEKLEAEGEAKEAIGFAKWLFSQRQVKNENELGTYPAITAQFPDYALFTYWTEDRRYKGQFFTISELYQIYLNQQK